MSLLSTITNDIAQASSAVLGVDVDSSWVEIANSKAGSHLALPVFRLAKELQKSPQQITAQLADEISLDSLQKVEAAGPYVNFWLADSVMSSEVAGSDSYLLGSEPNNKTAIVEFLSPNLAKPLSIGHLRNALQGKFIANLLRFEGYTVITDNHIGDWGTVFGMWVVGFEMFSSDEQLEQDGNKELGRMYVEVRKALKQEEADGKTHLADLIQAWLKKLEEGDSEAEKYHDTFSAVSLADIAAQMLKFDIVFDHNYGESFYVARGKEMVGELIESGVAARNDDGSVIIPLEDQGVETPMLIQKANGAALYATSDIATIEFREKEWSPELVVYIVGAEQQFHFKQLFASNTKAGWSNAELVHHWYGLIEELDEEGNRSKMSSRTNAVFLSDLVDSAVSKAKEIAAEGMSDTDIETIALGALTFQEFAAGHKSNTLFDWDSMFSLSGFSGPYIQYAAVRISSIIEKSGVTTFEAPSGYSWENESDLLWQMSKFTHAVSSSAEEWEGVKLTEYAFELSKAWNKYYENVQILSAKGADLQARLWIASKVHAHLVATLGILGISIPTKM